MKSTAPVPHTCPQIDKYIKDIKYHIHKERDLSNMSEEDIRYYAIEMNRELENCIDYLENMRSSNHDLREWGEALEQDLSKADDTIYYLEQKLSS